MFEDVVAKADLRIIHPSQFQGYVEHSRDPTPYLTAKTVVCIYPCGFLKTNKHRPRVA